MGHAGPSTQSLGHFFKTQDPATLNTCDQEQVHLIGQIMGGGGMLVLHRKTYQIVGASADVERILSCDRATVLGSPLSDVLPEAARLLENPTEDAGLHDILDMAIEADGVRYDVVTHAHSARIFIEFIPNSLPSNTVLRSSMRECSRACARILKTQNFSAALPIAVEALRKITGYSRVMVYEFQSDWAGKIVAESRDGALQSYYGLCFPAEDIPKQAREIMTMVPHRVMGATTDDTLVIEALPEQGDEIDLTWSLLRAASVMHTQYLRNMGIEAGFTSSLMHEENLWGMIALHDTNAGYLPYDVWSLVQEIGAALMMRFDQEQRTDINLMITKLREIENRFASELRRHGDVEDVLVKLIPVLQEFMGADGFAILYGSNLHTSGTTPPKEFVRDILRWASNHNEGLEILRTSALHHIWPKAKEHMDTACGVLIQPIAVHRACQLVWFRKPVTQTVHWAGRPDAKPAKDGRLSPRNSFEKWTTEHSDLSIAWSESELQSAREIFTEFLDIIAAQLLLKEENANLRQFAYAAAHDIKAPLRGIEMALDWMVEEEFEPGVVRETHAIARASSQQLLELTDGLLEMAVIREQAIEKGAVSIQSVIETARSLLSGMITKSKAKLTFGSFPIVYGDERLLVRLFLNLISNAIKYSHPDRPAEITITAGPVIDSTVEIRVADNGVGIAPEFAERIFRPMQRLHSREEAEGAGLGLAICKSIVAAHDGHMTLDTDHTDGAVFQVFLPTPRETLG